MGAILLLPPGDRSAALLREAAEPFRERFRFSMLLTDREGQQRCFVSADTAVILEFWRQAMALVSRSLCRAATCCLARPSAVLPDCGQSGLLPWPQALKLPLLRE